MNVDPSGRFFLTALLIGLFVGAVVGATVAGLNSAAQGNTGWGLVGDILLGGLIGGAIGAVGGMAVAGLTAAAPAIAGFLGTSFTLGSITLGGGAAIAVTATGAQLLAGGAVVVIGGMIFFAKIGKSNGYEVHKYGDDHEPDHMHLKGNGREIKFGIDGLPLKGEMPFNVQQRKVINALWDKILKGFGL